MIHLWASPSPPFLPFIYYICYLYAGVYPRFCPALHQPDLVTQAASAEFQAKEHTKIDQYSQFEGRIIAEFKH